jgi:hypothetical protein
MGMTAAAKTLDDLPPAAPLPVEDDADVILTPEDVARVLRVSVREAQRTMAKIPGVFRLGRLLRLRRADLRAWVGAMAGGGAA